MKYKEVKKVDHNHRVIGYCLINLKTASCYVIDVGGVNSLVVLNKVKDFEYIKGYTPCEVSYEDVFEVMAKYGATYSFDKPSLDKFIYHLEREPETTQEDLDEIKEMKEWQPQDENELYTIGNTSDEDLSNFSLN